MAFMALFCGMPGVVYGQEVKAAPVVEVEAQLLPGRGERPVVVELFSSQACVFCPQADRLFADLAQQKGIIGLTCHIDYFDVAEGSLAKPFCTDRQTDYMRSLGAGPNYTPQMVIDGAHDVVGYKTADVVSALKDAAGVDAIAVKPEKGGTFRLMLPESAKDTRIWLAIYDFPREITVAGGNNKGQRMTYFNVVSRLEDLGMAAGEAEKVISPALKSRNAGFAVLAQSQTDGTLVAAGQFKRKKAEEIFAPPSKE